MSDKQVGPGRKSKPKQRPVVNRTQLGPVGREPKTDPIVKKMRRRRGKKLVSEVRQTPALTTKRGLYGGTV